MRYRTLLLPMVLLALAHRTNAQGCSDAGVCTAGPLGDIALSSDSGALGYDVRSEARVTFSYAVGEQGTVISQIIPELTMSITERARLQLRIPYMSISGNLGENSGVGDFTITASYAFINQGSRRLDGFLGAKLNAGDATALAANTRTLPMPYQRSLGTKDLLIGLNFRDQRFSAGIAYQHVLVNENRNGFDHLFWMDNADAQGYFESAWLERADDAVARVQYAIPIGPLILQPGVLGIYHVTEDTREDMLLYPNGTVKVEGSEGLTLNMTGDARYNLGDDWSLEASFGTPVIVREARPDGLTRHWVLSIGARFAF